MKRIIIISLLFVSLFFATDFLRVAIEKLLHDAHFSGLESRSWLTQGSNYILAVVFVYALVHGIAGAILAWRSSSARLGVVLGLSLGLAVPLVSLVFGPPRPIIITDHQSAFMGVIYWANRYVPPLAGLIGALVWYHIVRRTTIQRSPDGTK